jgi:cytidylate kinase
MTREMGSGGREVAQLVAERLGLTIVLHELVEHEIARSLQVPEAVVHRRFEGGAGLRERWQIGAGRLAHHTAEEVLGLAQRDNVLIRGWGACALLREVPHAVRVRVCAPMELRVGRVMARRKLDDRAVVQKAIERNDAAHRRTLRAAFGVDREDPLLYDLVLNTARIPIETCAGLVCDLAESQAFRATEASRAILGDKTVEARVRTRLRERFIAGTGVANIAATVRGGRVLLEGVAIHPTLARDAGALVAAVAGVKDVVNRIEIVRGPRGL